MVATCKTVNPRLYACNKTINRMAPSVMVNNKYDDEIMAKGSRAFLDDTGGVVVAGQRALVPFVELALGGQRERVRGDHQPVVKPSANFGRDLREVRHAQAGCGWMPPTRSAEHRSALG